MQAVRHNIGSHSRQAVVSDQQDQVPRDQRKWHIQFQPSFSAAKSEAMKDSHTWMAGVTKVSLVYETKFWTKDISNMGLPRQITGSAFQMYDASTKDGSVNAITCFALVPSGSPAKTDDKVLGDQVASQVANVWKREKRVCRKKPGEALYYNNPVNSQYFDRDYCFSCDLGIHVCGSLFYDGDYIVNGWVSRCQTAFGRGDDFYQSLHRT
jgi:hypothetical protein